MTRSNWKELFAREDHIRLALEVRAAGAFVTKHEVRGLGDDNVLIFGGASHSARESKRPGRGEKDCFSVVVTPRPEQSEQSFEKSLLDLREEYPDAQLSGFSPKNSECCLRLFDRVVVKVGEAGTDFTPSEGWRERLPRNSNPDVTLALVYTPDVSPRALEDAVRRMREVDHLVSVVPLPLGAGDRIPLAGLTTAGSTDMMVISALRYLLPRTVAVRASWAALGWKVAQMALTYGADELAGWSAAEAAVYSERVRAASRVEFEELKRGVEEAGCALRAWYGQVVTS